MIKKFSNKCIFYDQCLFCDSPSPNRYGICRPCFKELPWLEEHCPQCALPLSANQAHTLCETCQTNPPPFTRTFAPFEYQFPVQRAIQHGKYRKHAYWYGAFGLLMADLFKELSQADLLIPIPARRATLIKRGFNQAQLLAQVIATELERPIDTNRLSLEDRDTAQHLLSRTLRKARLRPEIYCNKPLEGASVALIDDVMTTGATLREASAALLDAGASEVECWVIARTP